MNTAPNKTPPAEMAAKLEERYRCIVEKCHQLKMDAEAWNALHPDDEPILINLDFRKDLEEGDHRGLGGTSQ